MCTLLDCVSYGNVEAEGGMSCITVNQEEEENLLHHKEQVKYTAGTELSKRINLSEKGLPGYQSTFCTCKGCILHTGSLTFIAASSCAASKTDKHAK